VKEALLYKKLANQTVSCFLCAHHCTIKPDSYGFCGVRKNLNGSLYTEVFEKLIASNVDPVEKKPLYHFLPGSNTYSIATPGCNFRCGFCQNWEISQPTTNTGIQNIKSVSPETIVKSAISSGCKSISCTYTEPTIYFEYAYEIIKLEKQNNLNTVFVSNGYMSPQMLELAAPYLDGCNIDLKSFRDPFYKKICKASLEPVLKSLKWISDSTIWLEITTLLVSGENDSDEELTDIANFIYELNPDIPWHISRFFPKYEFLDHAATPAVTIKRAAVIGKKAGLNYIYGGNISGRCDTICFRCGSELISREGYNILESKIENSRCPRCQSVIAGIWK
jgi:pyruvate formate lyase activating enzyme